MARGGYRKPTNGAVVSPPGALSKRKATENKKADTHTVFLTAHKSSTFQFHCVSLLI